MGGQPPPWKWTQTPTRSSGGSHIPKAYQDGRRGAPRAERPPSCTMCSGCTTPNASGWNGHP